MGAYFGTTKHVVGVVAIVLITMALYNRFAPASVRGIVGG